MKSVLSPFGQTGNGLIGKESGYEAIMRDGGTAVAQNDEDTRACGSRKKTGRTSLYVPDILYVLC
jgi:hypothetical protein